MSRQRAGAACCWAIGLALVLPACWQRLDYGSANGRKDEGPAGDDGRGETSVEKGAGGDAASNGRGGQGGGAGAAGSSTAGNSGTRDAGAANSDPGPPADAMSDASGTAAGAATDATAASPVACAEIGNQARAILTTNCAPCHQAPAKQGNFDFCLDPVTLTTAVGSTGKRFVTPGDPESSRLYQRVAAGEMPPATRTQRPTPAEIAVLRTWIADCVGPHGDPGFGPSDAAPPTQNPPDAAVPIDVGSGCGGPGQACCAANACQNGGCCVLGTCRASGQTCEGPAGPYSEGGYPGTCTMGSCQSTTAACGNIGEACCGTMAACTATRANCPGGQRCEACGASGQPCCANATCATGLDCQGNGFGRVGACQPCGGAGQACCGNGPVATQICQMGLVCTFVTGTGDRCGGGSGGAGPATN